jgi:hypothetical protein
VADEDVTLFAGEGQNDIIFLRDVDAGDASGAITLTGYYAPTQSP